MPAAGRWDLIRLLRG